MSFQNSEGFPIEDWIIELAELVSVREGIQKREAHLRILENLSEFIGYYELGFSTKKAFKFFWGEKI